MNPDDLILVSVDDHVVEPPDMFVGRLPRKYEAEAPHLVRTDDGFDVWKFRQYTIPNSALNAIAGRPKEEYGLEPQGLDEIRPGCYDVHERVKDMSAGGLLAQMCFPTFPGFAGRLFATDDPDFSLALVRAYNDWHIDAWAGAYPGRFIPMALPVIWDPAACAQEIRRVAEKGCHSFTFTENPAAMGYPSFHTEHFLTCFISDSVGLGLRNEIGIDNIAWECDYPHSDSLWPYAPEKLHADFVKHNVPDDDINKITYENAMRWYQFDPFAHVPREQATVGALRRSVSGHDISVQPRSTHLVGAQEKLAGYHRRVEAALSTAPTTR